MYLSEIFDQLTHGEMSQIALGGANASGIIEADYPKVLAHINLALTELHKRFLIKEGSVTVQQYDHIQTYKLDRKYAETNLESTEQYKYIKDSIYEPFYNDVLRIETVVNEEGETLYLNDKNEYWSVHTPTYNSVQVPYPEKENQMIVTYRADHERLVSDNLDPTTTEVNISSTYLESLLFYVASRLYAAIPDGSNDAVMYMTKFEASCLKLEELNLSNTDDTSNQRIWRNQWP